MVNSNLEQQVSNIKLKLQSMSPPQITGARLGELIRDLGINVREIVGITTGSGALTKFIASHLNDILTECGKTGSDRLYQIEVAEIQDSKVDEKHFWSAFVKTNSNKRIFVNRANDVVISNNSYSSLPDEFEILAATPEELDKIRAEFIREFIKKDDSQESELGEAIPYVDWVRNLKRHYPEISRKWGKYRFDSIIKLFQKKVIDVGLEQSNATLLSEKLKRSQNEIYSEKISNKNKINTHPKGESHIEPIDPLKSAIIYAIQRMSQSELRELKIPAGLLLDAFLENKK